jgi:tRNA threonylcarbamoyladenosine biosynthesis protein TsaB
MITLVLEASTYAGSVALIEDGALRGARSVAMRGREHEALMPAVAALLEEQGIARSLLGRVVCGAGPGSFTSLRIAGAIAKGLALSMGCPLVPVSSLALLVGSLEHPAPGRYLGAIDALRGEHYVALFEVTKTGDVDALGPEGRVPTPSVREHAELLDAMPVGPDQVGAGQREPHARGALRLRPFIESSPAADLARWEPAYGRLAEAQVKWEALHGRPLERV